MDFLNVNEVLNELDTTETMTAAEFGCGSAQFAITLARKLKMGKVYALDIQEDKLSAIKGRLSVEKVRNVQTILCDLESSRGSTLKENSLDIVLIPNLFFQVENRNAILKEAKRIVKPQGQIMVIDWLTESAFGPKAALLVNPDEMKEMAKSMNLHFKKEFMAGDYHYALLFVK